MKLSNGQKSHPRGGRWLYFRHFHQSGTQSKSPQTAGGHFIGPPPHTDSGNCVAVVCTAPQGFPCWGRWLLSGQECPSVGEGNWPERPPETRGDRAGWAGLSGWAEHVTLPGWLAGWLGVGWGGKAWLCEAEIDCHLWQESEPVKFLSASDPGATGKGISVTFNSISQASESRR